MEIDDSEWSKTMSITKQTMPETMYRASRCCRMLGNPTAYLILQCLGQNRKTPGELSRELRAPVSTISMTLRHLRQLDLVRYETKGNTKEYWIKERKILAILSLLEQWVESMRKKQA